MAKMDSEQLQLFEDQVIRTAWTKENKKEITQCES